VILEQHTRSKLGRVPQVRASGPGLKKMGDPDSLYAALETTACAAFSEESRMNFANATKLDRKSGGSPTVFPNL
jgi:hypothetical protein